jgi:hypothetical protein
MAKKGKGGKRAKAKGPFHVDLNAANWQHFSDDQELQAFLNAHVTGDAVASRSQANWRNVTLHISIEPKKGPSAYDSKTEVTYIGICPKQPCP